MPPGDFPITISRFGEGQGESLTLLGNSVIPKWPLKPKTMEKFKEKAQSGDK